MHPKRKKYKLYHGAQKRPPLTIIIMIIMIIIIIITRQVLGRPVCDRVAIPENEKLYANYAAAFQL